MNHNESSQQHQKATVCILRELLSVHKQDGALRRQKPGFFVYEGAGFTTQQTFSPSPAGISHRGLSLFPYIITECAHL